MERGMKVVTIVGARPQFIKAAVLSRELRKEHIEILVHTGQHYDDNMSAVFFKELEIPEPDYNLGIGSGSHGKQTGEMLAGIEEILLKEKPDWVLVYGDTNSTLAGALAASKLHIKIAHVEAGLRSFNRNMPEEINRVLTDHLSNLLFCPTDTAVNNLRLEGITKGVHQVGDVMYDALQWALDLGDEYSSILARLKLEPKSYLLATVHRAENTDDPARLQGILDAFNQVDEPLVFPVHPRTRKKLAELAWQPASHVILLDPLRYIDMVFLEKNALVILTDSGGMQKEAHWLEVPCVTLREETEWVETLAGNWNQLAGVDPQKIVSSVQLVSQVSRNIRHNTTLTPAAPIIVKLLSNLNSPTGAGK
jgi:UDP-N-acetylglucosamine 2-epimerase